MLSRGRAALNDVLRRGHAIVNLSSGEIGLLHAAVSAGREFFQRGLEDKRRCSSADFNHGYRPLGREYSISPDRPDLNECFTIWNDRTDLFRHAEEVEDLARTWAAYRRTAASLVHSFVDSVAEYFGAATTVNFESASYLQMNSYCDEVNDRDLLQDLHEDGHLVTLHHASGPGLEVRLDGHTRPMAVPPEALLLMPGSVMTELTEAAVPPLYHQVRNLHIAGRISLMYFVNPALDQPVHAWTGGDQTIDLRDRIRSNPSMFGLVDVPLL
jgi:isopenicillin N synthase-like dioxygenase